MERDYFGYSMTSLREQFPQLEHESDFMLSPILDCAFRLFSQKLKEDPESFGITDVKFDPQNFNRCTIVINGKIVTFGCGQGHDIDAWDGESSWYMIKSIGWRGGENEAKIFSKILTSFIAEIPYKTLCSMAAERMKEDRYRLGDEMRKFYFPRG